MSEKGNWELLLIEAEHAAASAHLVTAAEGIVYKREVPADGKLVLLAARALSANLQRGRLLEIVQDLKQQLQSARAALPAAELAEIQIRADAPIDRELMGIPDLAVREQVRHALGDRRMLLQELRRRARIEQHQAEVTDGHRQNAAALGDMAMASENELQEARAERDVYLKRCGYALACLNMERSDGRYLAKQALRGEYKHSCTDRIPPPHPYENKNHEEGGTPGASTG